ncbi:MAG: hypothetical protein HC932_02740 [Thermales bacterium]|nr:hypothetical protein [Thermales bacterium]
MQLFQNVIKNKGAILLSSHVLNEVQSYCDRIIMIKDGKIILTDTTQNILNQAQKEFRLKNLPKKLKETIEKSNLTTNFSIDGNETIFYTANREDVIKILTQNNFYDFYIEKPTLESTFLNLYN